jgi:RNA polymerase sigma-70 factor (ECF subfamily)
VNDDQDLIAASLRGETGAFGQLVGRYQNRLFNSLTRMTGSVEDAEDITQEAFVHAFQKLHTFRGGSRFYSWLFRIALNAAVTLHRKRDKATASVEAVREQVGFEPADARPNSTPQAPLETSERQALVQRTLRELPEEFRQVLVLREMDEMSYEEIAEIVDCPIGTVRSRIHRARQELRDRLAAILREP